MAATMDAMIPRRGQPQLHYTSSLASSTTPYITVGRAHLLLFTHLVVELFGLGVVGIRCRGAGQVINYDKLDQAAGFIGVLFQLKINELAVEQQCPNTIIMNHLSCESRASLKMCINL